MFSFKRTLRTCALSAALAAAFGVAHAQPELLLTTPSSDAPTAIAERFLKTQGVGRFGLIDSDLEYLLSEASYRTAHNGVSHVYFEQMVRGVPVFGGIAQVNVLPDGRVLNATSSFEGKALARANDPSPSLSAADAVRAAARDIGYVNFSPTPVEATAQTHGKQVFAGAGLSAEDIAVKLVYQPHGTELRLAWQFVVDRFQEESRVLDLRYDAHTGALLASDDYVEQADEGGASHAKAQVGVKVASYDVEYRVSPLGQESPTHPGVGHALVTNPQVENASPLGWQESRDDPPAGAPQYLVTRGNNVRAQWDLLSSNSGSNTDANRPLGVWDDQTNTLSFDFPWVETEAPDSTTNRVAATVNLFYWNNIIHDVMYQYGFDEASGNFQFNNFGRGGSQNDGVVADALDGSQAATPSTNNANFSTPTDGGSGRMQMFRWTAPAGLRVLSPYQADYTALVGGFGAPIVPDYQNELVPADDGNADPVLALQGCATTWTNAAAVAGKVALIKRGTCEFGTKAYNAQLNGAVAAVIYNNANDEPLSMGPGTQGALVTIPVISLGQAQGDALRDAAAADPVQVQFLATTMADRDSDFDAGIMAHEYGHGIGYRLTGPRTQNCLSGDEQQGEGWSDFFALMFTMTDDVCSVPRGVGTYTSFQAITGPGIRRYPYTPDMEVNPFTFADVADEAQSVPHGVGSVWNTMLWDMSCKLMDRYGYDPDIYSRGGGNGLSMQLVTDGLKLQGCYPQFVQSRDGILAADAAKAQSDPAYLSNRCIIWHAFARRGLGKDASSGTYQSRSDQTEDFTVPADCENFTVEVTASNGTVSPAGPVTADFEEVLSFDLTPAPGFQLVSVGGCEGDLVGTTFTTWPMVRSCTLAVQFEEVAIFSDGFED